MKLLYTASFLTTSLNAFRTTFEDSIPVNEMPTLLELGAGRHMYQSYMMLIAIVPFFNGDKKAARDYIIKHGCYCFPGGVEYDPKIVGPRTVNGVQYHGPALDALDGLCKDLWRAQTCINLDFDCDIEDYDTYPFQLLYQDESNPNEMPEISCGPGIENNGGFYNKPKNKCALNICEAEKEFVLRVKDLIESGFQLTEEYSNIKDNQYHKFCPVGVFSNTLPRAGSLRTCCGNNMDRRLFNPFINECCSDGKARKIGQC